MQGEQQDDRKGTLSYLGTRRTRSWTSFEERFTKTARPSVPSNDIGWAGKIETFIPDKDNWPVLRHNGETKGVFGMLVVPYVNEGETMHTVHLLGQNSQSLCQIDFTDTEWKGWVLGYKNADSPITKRSICVAASEKFMDVAKESGVTLKADNAEALFRSCCAHFTGTGLAEALKIDPFLFRKKRTGEKQPNLSIVR